MAEENGSGPATKADLKALEERLEKSIEESSHAVEERLLEALRDTETKLLRAFYSYAQTTDKRLVLVEGADANVLSRLGTVESRILEIERRLNMPPGSAA